MIKYIALYRRPSDRDFDDRYFAEHLPLVARTPGLLRTEVAKVGRVHLAGFLGDVEPYLIAEMYFASAEAMRTALRSPEWRRCGENLAEIGGIELVTMFSAEVLTRPVDHVDTAES
ncbi:uncharacterized protein (TIGR02118 family) [Actinoalloteichus hoggarensis]|uniref:EthD protein n=1 Tax=Actinoalloteichus hoggarensis TaxID=1470176 RepID=A0A221VXI7_9PSEU|nr:EthD family reductase [Actinoalloteichus hoggarensis]ASO18270.1 EthD protein [Actinoalloteichus hoggarensis]MBB5921630.1 uncharacterized protein (TIGR02118 family) [Actinoalloteichus hoggarensis]